MSDQLTFKGRPIVRSNNEIYYGNPSDSHVVYIQILSTAEKNGVQVANKLNVQLLSNDPSLSPSARIIKQSEKPGLYSALDIGYIWLNRALAGK